MPAPGCCAQACGPQPLTQSWGQAAEGTGSSTLQSPPKNPVSFFLTPGTWDLPSAPVWTGGPCALSLGD